MTTKEMRLISDDLGKPEFRENTQNLDNAEAWKVIKNNIKTKDPALFLRVQKLNSDELRKNGFTLTAMILPLLQDS